jgi:ribonuclease HI
MAWIYFDGMFRGESGTCGIGLMLSFEHLHFITRKNNLVHGTNKKGDLQSLLELLICALKGIFHTLQVFRDSKLVVDWMNEEVKLNDLGLLLIVHNLKSCEIKFHILSISHFYVD